MSLIRSALILVISLTFVFAPAANACTIEIEPLRKSFRNAENVFLGEIVSAESKWDEELPANLRGQYKFLEKITFKVVKSWKGDNRAEVVTYAVPNCSCPKREFDFARGKRFLVFADKNSFYDSCHIFSVPLDEASVRDASSEMKRLNNFWFRAWARFYPF